MRYRLRITSGKSKGSNIELEQGHVLTIGRSPSNDVCIPDTEISRIHCQIELRGDTCNITDLNSTNGTFFNDERIDEVNIDNGAVVRVGLTTLVFECYGEAAQQTPQAKPEPSATPRTVVCSECGRKMSEADLAAGLARRIGSGFYCSRCSGEFADVEVIEDKPGALYDNAQIDAEAEPDESVADEMLGQVVAGNKIIEAINEGPLGTLYRAEQISMSRPVALRILREGGDATGELLEAFAQRANAGGQLTHPNIVVVHDSGQQGDLHYVSMELVDGDSVRDLLLKHGRLSTPEALHIAVHMARALRHAWQQGVVHGDIHPGNILVAKDRVAKLTDFAPLPPVALNMMRPAQQLAYMRYTAPERIAGQEADAAGDIYALGASLFHMLCGRPPVLAESLDELKDRLPDAQVPPPSSLRDDLSGELDPLLAKMLAKSPAERYETPADLVDAIKRVAKAIRQ